MNNPLKQRVIGVIILIAIGVIVFPLIFDRPEQQNDLLSSQAPNTPALPEQGELANLPNLADSDVDTINQVLTDSMTSTNNSTDIDNTLSELIAREAWTIQVGAFNEMDNATGLQAKLLDQGYTAYLRRNADGLYQVFVGPELNRNNAETRLDELNQALDLEGIVLPFVPAPQTIISADQG